MKKRNFIRLFERKKSRIDSRIKRDYIENGIATVHCCISNYNDIINTYSAKDQESLNPDFVEYLQDVATPIPDECPACFEHHRELFVGRREENHRGNYS